MSNYQLAKRAVKLFTSEYVGKSINRANQRHWISEMKTIGDRWLFAKPVQRKEAV